MHMISPRIYSHARVSPEGAFLGNEYFRETTETRPSLVIDAGGSVKVVGGIAYDPNKPPGYEHSDLKSMYLSRQALASRAQPSTLTQDQMLQKFNYN